MGTPPLGDPVDKYAKMSRKEHPFKLLYKLHCIIGYDMSVKLVQKPLNTVEIANTTIH